MESIKLYRHFVQAPRADYYYRPFHLCDFNIELVTTIEEADFILTNQKGRSDLLKNKISIENLRKTVLYVNDDNPAWIFSEPYSYKFIAQPDRSSADMAKHNAIAIPLVMGDHIPIHEDLEYIEYLRNIPKKYDFYFAGQLHYHNRDKLKNLNLKNSVIKPAPNVYAQSPEQRLGSIKKYLEELAQAKFGFAPRGAGSSSFRLCECLLVGTIPIVTDAIQLPYTDLANWDEFAITGNISNVNLLAKQAEEIDAKIYRDKGMEFFDRYCNTRQINNSIIRRLKNAT